MSKFNSNKVASWLDDAGIRLAKAGKHIVDVVKDPHFQLGALPTVPTAVSAYFLIKKYKKQAKEKEGLYKKALAKDHAILKELSTKAEMDKERQERLLAADSELKKIMKEQQSELRVLNDRIAELENKKANDE